MNSVSFDDLCKEIEGKFFGEDIRRLIHTFPLNYTGQEAAKLLNLSSIRGSTLKFICLETIKRKMYACTCHEAKLIVDCFPITIDKFRALRTIGSHICDPQNYIEVLRAFLFRDDREKAERYMIGLAHKGNAPEPGQMPIPPSRPASADLVRLQRPTSRAERLVDYIAGSFVDLFSYYFEAEPERDEAYKQEVGSQTWVSPEQEQECDAKAAPLPGLAQAVQGGGGDRDRDSLASGSLNLEDSGDEGEKEGQQQPMDPTVLQQLVPKSHGTPPTSKGCLPSVGAPNRELEMVEMGGGSSKSLSSAGASHIIEVRPPEDSDEFDAGDRQQTTTSFQPQQTVVT